MREIKNAYNILVGKPEGKRPLRRARRRWENNIRTLVKWEWKVWTACIWVRVGTSGRLL
jgi:hypothetical protein